MHNSLIKINLIARLGLAFVFFYHGLMPKILWLSPIEKELVDLHNLGIPAAILSPLAGLSEILLALAIVFYRKSLLPVYAGAALLVVLLLDVALVKPGLLIEAFNPVSINIVTLVLCYLVVITHREIEFGGKGDSGHQGLS
ncbi:MULTISPECIES: DoxX-like family protein [unclassified Microbulbifer]|uniref:DoxX-like family protein n=1 Tax=unclassified Microbulbifer TaxID=2619833 RepID=UPI0027E545BF|nr:MULTISPECIES: DoxX-like family protein [unclassified Microbulbifer]